MSRRYILDGYNVLHASRRWSDLSREAQREKFIRYLDEGRLTGSPRNAVIVVLDGFAAPLTRLRLSLVQLVFSGHRDADSVIKELVGDLANPREAVVVTNDNAIHQAVRGSGARVMSCEEFWSLDHKAEPRRYRQKLDAHSEESINRELRRLWRVE